MPFTLEELLPEVQQLRTVQLHETVEHAINLMHQHGCNQLPVVGSDGASIEQVVTFDSILQSIQSFGTRPEALLVRDVARRVRSYAPDADLLTTLDEIQRDNFALIVDDSNQLTGIVTTSDIAAFFRAYAEDLMQVEGIESSLKDAIKALYAGDQGALDTAIETVTDRSAEVRKRLPLALKAYCGKAGISANPGELDMEALVEAERKLGLSGASKKFEDLSFDEFTHVLLRHPKAPKLSQSKDVAELRSLLERVRNARNKLAHFRGELSSEERRTIRFASEWLERNLPSLAMEPAAAVVAALPVGEATPGAPPEEDEPGPQGSYAPLASYLDRQAAEVRTLTLSFQDIETILGKELPRSAFDYRAWWSNDPTKPQSTAWLDQGWRTTAISMTERRLTFVRTNDREEAYISFFAKLNSRLQVEGFPLRDISPQGQNWIVLASLEWIGPDSANISVAFTRRKQVRVELYLDSGDKDINKKRFDELLGRRAQVEAAFGEPLQWERMDDKRACRVAVYTRAQILTDADNPALLDWVARKAMDLVLAFVLYFHEER